MRAVDLPPRSGWQDTPVLRKVGRLMASIPWRALPPLATRNPLLDLTTERGTLQLFLPTPSTLVSRAHGHMETAMAGAWVRCTSKLWRPGIRVAVFNDWDLMESYDSAARQQLTDWVLEHRSQFDGAWFCTSSRMVAMGGSVAGAVTAVAGVTLHASLQRAQFESTLRARLGLLQRSRWRACLRASSPSGRGARVLP